VDLAIDPLLKLLPDIRAQAQEPNAPSLLGPVGPYDLSIGLNRRMAPRKGELQTASVAFNDGSDDLAAQPFFADVDDDSAAIRSKSDVGQLVEPPARMGTALCGR
jgi:hypothetical protein